MINRNLNYKGKINLIIGPMFSGKTSELINNFERYEIGGKKCIMIKHSFDMRYNNNEHKNVLITHNGIKMHGVVSSTLKELDEEISKYDVICIDEIQFFNDAIIYCEKWANEGKIVEACGLNGTYERKPFEIISKLLPLVENLKFKNAICRKNGNNAYFSKLKTNTQDESMNDKHIKSTKKQKTNIRIGGMDEYEAVDREYYFIDNIAL